MHGDKILQEEKDAVVKLLEVIKDKKSNVDKAKLQDFINRLVKADQLLAKAAINDAAGGKPAWCGRRNLNRHGEAFEGAFFVVAHQETHTLP